MKSLRAYLLRRNGRDVCLKDVTNEVVFKSRTTEVEKRKGADGGWGDGQQSYALSFSALMIETHVQVGERKRCVYVGERVQRSSDELWNLSYHQKKKLPFQPQAIHTYFFQYKRVSIHLILPIKVPKPPISHFMNNTGIPYVFGCETRAPTVGPRKRSIGRGLPHGPPGSRQRGLCRPYAPLGTFTRTYDCINARNGMNWHLRRDWDMLTVAT